MSRKKRRLSALLFAAACLAACAQPASAKKPSKPPAKTPPQLRSDYILRLQQLNIPAPDAHTLGSLWSPESSLSDLSADYKAHHVNDIITIEVAVQTTSAQTGTVNSQRTLSAKSSFSGGFGSYSIAGATPLINASSASALKGQGQTSTATTFTTSLTGQVIAVLPNGNMVVEAERQVFMNNQHEDVVVRGVVRPGDIAPNNSVPSSALSNLEIEMKGKGIISDSVRSPNVITKAIMWLFGF